MPSEFLLLAIALGAIVYSVAALLRAHRPTKRPLPRDTALHHDSKAAVSAFLARRGRRYTWYLLVVSTFLAALIVKSLILYYG